MTSSFGHCENTFTKFYTVLCEKTCYTKEILCSILLKMHSKFRCDTRKIYSLVCMFLYFIYLADATFDDSEPPLACHTVHKVIHNFMKSFINYITEIRILSPLNQKLWFYIKTNFEPRLQFCGKYHSHYCNENTSHFHFLHENNVLSLTTYSFQDKVDK